MTADPIKVATAVAARVDAIEVTIGQQGSAIEGVRKDVTALTGTVKSILKRQEEKEGQPDWLRMRSPQQCVDTLRAAVVWHDQFLPWLGAPLPLCWPWHPLLVVEVLALAEQYEAAYAATPDKVSDFLTRWLPGFRSRSRNAYGACNRTEHHDGHSYRVDLACLDDMARWWASSRVGLAPGLKEFSE